MRRFAEVNPQSDGCLELGGLPSENLGDSASGVSVIPSGSGVALMSGNVSYVCNCISILK